MAAPIERFLAIETASSILLLLVTAIALGLANSPLAGAYQSFWHTPFGFRLGSFAFERDLHFWVNDALMTIFFFVVGLEIRREIHNGELAEWKRAALPLAAALGGMLAPAAIFAAFNHGTPSQHGWGTPMATDIAFAVGVLGLLGKRVPPALRVLLLALAVIDDIGAIVVIAIFYSSGLAFTGFGIFFIGLAITLVMQWIGVRPPLLYVAPAAIMWAGTYMSGIHPTIAGVLVGLLTPVAPWYGPSQLRSMLKDAVDALDPKTKPNEAALREQAIPLRVATTEVLSPLERLTHGLHHWVAFGIMPLFALANAGVPLGDAQLHGQGLLVLAGVGLGLVIGKPIGIVAACWLTVKLGVAKLPTGIRWRDVLVVGIVGGIGFTMAIFVAGLGFEKGPLLETAKLSILLASTAAGVLGLVAGALLLPRHLAPGAAQTAAEAEASTAR